MQERQQTGQGSDLGFLWILGLIIGALYLIWYFNKDHIVATLFQVRFYEIMGVDYVFSLWNRFIQQFGFSLPNLGLGELTTFIANDTSGKGVNFTLLWDISTVIGNYIRYPLTLLLFGAGGWLYFFGTPRKFRHVYNAQTFKEVEKENWPQIRAVAAVDLVKQNLDVGPWAIALSPMRFCEKNGLINVSKQNGKEIALLKRGAALRVLALQLGPRWYGVEHLPPYLKALFAIFAARINNDKKSAEQLLEQISASAAGHHLNFGGAEKLLYKHRYEKKVTEITMLHSYVTSVFASLLVGAREVGVLASAEFIWLKPLDRRMWYMLNSVGRATAVAEICGAFAHWLAEKKLGLPLMVPMVEEAVRGLEASLSELYYTTTEDE